MNDILITDLSCALPNDRIISCDKNSFSPIARKRTGCWRLIEYQADLYSGNFLQTTDPEASTLTIPLNLKGYYAISIGIAATGVKSSETAVEVRLGKEGKWQYIRTYEWNSITEEPWMIDDATGKDLEIRYPKGTNGNSEKTLVSRIFSIRAKEVSKEDVEVLENKEHRMNLFITDGNGIYYSDDPGNEIYERYFRPFSGSEWKTCSFGVGGADVVHYNTKVGTIWGEDAWDFEPGYEAPYKKVKEMINSGIDPMKAAIDKAHEIGVPISTYIRNQAWTCEPPLDHIIRSKFYIKHPEYCCIEADGTILGSKLSIAYKDVRIQLNAIISECIERGADGVGICFVRGFPLCRYEKPVLDLYKKMFGGEENESCLDDNKLRKVWSVFATQWMREIRQLLDKAGPSRLLKKRQLTIFCGPNIEWNLQYGIDVSLWAREKIIDIVIPYPRDCEHNYEILLEGISEYAKALSGYQVELLPSLGSYADHRISIMEYRKRANLLYKKGATGLSRWDTAHWMTELCWDEPEVQRLLSENYSPPAFNRIISTAGLERVIFTPRIGV